jgi:hypothetical protein
MALETLALIQQLQQKPNFEKLTDHNAQPKTEQAQRIAAIRPEVPKSFLRSNKNKTLKYVTPDTGFNKLQKSEIPRFSFERESKFEPVGIETNNSICSASLFTQLIDSIERKYVVTIGHCLSDELKLLLQDNIQFLTDPKTNYEGSTLLDPAIAIPYEVFTKLSDKIQLVSLQEYIDPSVKKLMENYKTSSNCNIQNPNSNIYNANLISQLENPDHPE